MKTKLSYWFVVLHVIFVFILAALNGLLAPFYIFCGVIYTIWRLYVSIKEDNEQESMLILVFGIMFVSAWPIFLLCYIDEKMNRIL